MRWSPRGSIIDEKLYKQRLWVYERVGVASELKWKPTQNLKPSCFLPFARFGCPRLPSPPRDSFMSHAATYVARGRQGKGVSSTRSIPSIGTVRGRPGYAPRTYQEAGYGRTIRGRFGPLKIAIDGLVAVIFHRVGVKATTILENRRTISSSSTRNPVSSEAFDHQLFRVYLFDEK
ncbi:hypothetical protein F3Y22_tig00110812pilonHSYRG00119 [Hibiscus syriacus]|uniref:Uncharacterized protein n=1 Tax=Hibiscus syriacus TaxID=106335 RepID=A0A6A2ZQ32_HIBSY|nr:hypothetical protein F3Y22_tig00110812pilonHSYRG00119 [Hibiscus syriacus]